MKKNFSPPSSLFIVSWASLNMYIDLNTKIQNKALEMSEFLDKIEKTVLELLDKAQKDPHFRASKDLATVVHEISEDIEKQLSEQSNFFPYD
jgi:methyl-accepting chemotaxis protein